MKDMKKFFVFIKDVIISIFIYIIGVIHFLLGSILILLVGIFTTGWLFEKVIKIFSRLITILAFVRVKVEGVEENLFPGGKYILMLNHVNIFDGFVFNGSFPGKLRGIEEESHMKWPVYGPLMKRIGMIPINRKNARKALESLKRSAELLIEQKNLSIGVMPEGTRTITGELGKFKKGGFLLAIESGLDIIPVIQTGSYKIKQKTKWMIRPGRVKIRYEKAISTKGFTRENVNELMDKVRNVMLKYLE